MDRENLKASRRLQRIASRIKFIVSQVIQHELRDPRLGMITVLAVEPTEDLKEAKIYVSVLGSRGSQSKSEHALNQARGTIQQVLGKNLKTRNTPHLRFIFDDSYSKLSRIEALIQEASQEDRKTTMARKPSKRPGPEPASGKSTKRSGKGKGFPLEEKGEERNSGEEEEEFEEEEKKEESEDEEFEEDLDEEFEEEVEEEAKEKDKEKKEEPVVEEEELEDLDEEDEDFEDEEEEEDLEEEEEDLDYEDEEEEEEEEEEYKEGL